ncbi:MAG: porin family protein [Muribaculaceae bacterium]|nr:porin family protein [Bacteroidales bacterium]MDE6040236.1 porin family protein [Muribaculaceae bacterium]
MKSAFYHSPEALRRICLILLAVLCAGVGNAYAQAAPYKFDLGVDLGMSGYIGDANRSNFMSHPGFDGQLSFRYIPDTRWAIRGIASGMGLSGNTADMSNVLPDMAEHSFTASVYSLEARAEFNFFAYGIGETYKRLRRWSPYLTLGVGACLSSAGGNTAVAPMIPVGAGVRYKIKERWNLGVEFTFTKTFSDHIDGKDLADLNQIKTAFYKNTDWISRLTIGVSYEFGKRCETCHYVD